MSHLKEEHQYVHTYLKCGGITLQIGDDNPFGKIPVNQACEETVNKDTQTPGGAKAFSLKSKAVSKYYLVAEYRSIFMRNMKDMLNLNKSSWLQKWGRYTIIAIYYYYLQKGSESWPLFS